MRVLVLLAVILGIWAKSCFGKISDRTAYHILEGTSCIHSTGKCTEPQTSVNTYTSTDGILTPMTVYSIELQVTCKTGQVSLESLVNVPEVNIRY